MKWGVVVIVLFFGFASSVEASELYASGYFTQSLYRLSQTNGAATRVGGFNTNSKMRDLASDTRPESYRMWATSYDGQLFRINPVTGIATVVGSFGLPATEQIRTLAFDIAGGKLYGTSDPSSKLYEINPDTAALTLIGDVGLADLGGMGADGLGNLFGIKEGTGEIYAIDRLTGTPALVSTVPVTYISDLAFRPEDQTLFGITHVGPVETYKSLYIIDMVNGNATRLGYTEMSENAMAGLAFGAAVPEPGMFALLSIGAMALGRRRNR